MDFNQLLEPIAGESAVGCYLKDDRSVYRGLRNTFNAAQSSFRRLIETPDSSTDEALFEENQNNWQAVNEACWQALTEKSKDVEIVCWWTMSLVFQRDSITKVAAALELLPQFFEQFWPDVQPFLPEAKLKANSPEELKSLRAEFQLKPIIQLLGESAGSGLLYMPLQMLALVGEIDHGQYLSATKAGKLAELKQQAQKEFPEYKEDITSTVIALDLAIQSMDKLDAWLKHTATEMGIAVISCQFLKSNLTDCLSAIKYLVADSYPVWPLDKSSQPDNQAPAEVSEPETMPTPSNNNDIEQAAPVQQQAVVTHHVATVGLTSRDQAFQELRKIADYFSKYEPHSPVSFLIEKAIRWGYMPLPELMQELTSGNDKALAQINLVTGIDGEKADISSHQIAPQEPISATKTELTTNDSTEPQISAIKESVSSAAAVPTPQTSSPEATPKGDNKTSSSTDGFSW